MTLFQKSLVVTNRAKYLMKPLGPKTVQAIHRYFKYGLKEYALFIFTVILNYMLAFVFKFSYLEVEKSPISINPLITSFISYPKTIFHEQSCYRVPEQSDLFFPKCITVFST